MSKNQAERHQMALDFITGYYKDGMIVALAWLFQGGEIPGVENISAPKLRSWFESTNDQYWIALLQTDPQEAMDQLTQWSHADKNNVPEAVAA